MFALFQLALVAILSYAALVAAVWALVDAARTPGEAFTSAGKQSKTLWLVLTGIASALLIVLAPHPFGNGGGVINFLGIGAAAAVIIYHVSVKPAVAPYRNIRRPKGGNSGPSRGGW